VAAANLFPFIVIGTEQVGIGFKGRAILAKLGEYGTNAFEKGIVVAAAKLMHGLDLLAAATLAVLDATEMKMMFSSRMWRPHRKNKKKKKPEEIVDRQHWKKKKLRNNYRM
jgi:hypothetical protein